jgi:hypothetical protein
MARSEFQFWRGVGGTCPEPQRRCWGQAADRKSGDGIAAKVSMAADLRKLAVRVGPAVGDRKAKKMLEVSLTNGKPVKILICIGSGDRDRPAARYCVVNLLGINSFCLVVNYGDRHFKYASQTGKWMGKNTASMLWITSNSRVPGLRNR